MSKEAFAEIMSGGAEPQAQQTQQEPSKGLIGSMIEGIQAVAPGLSLDKILGDVGHELGQMGAHGAHEAAAALFNGSAFVMYPRAGQEQESQAQGNVEPAKDFSLKEILDAPAPETPQQSMERDTGRSM